jgi:hypothetical protein
MSAAGVTVFCDPTLARVVREVGAQAGYEVAVLSAPAPLMVQQMFPRPWWWPHFKAGPARWVRRGLR